MYHDPTPQYDEWIVISPRLKKMLQLNSINILSDDTTDDDDDDDDDAHVAATQLRWFNHCLEQSSCNNLLYYYQINHAESLSFAIALKYLQNPFQSQANPVVFKISLVFLIELKQNKIKKQYKESIK